jgi:ElaB/YqjD/DUF883 family membrane-anchored ribosome-binding protein
MSAENEGDIIVTVVGGALYVAWHTARLATIGGIEAAKLGFHATRAVIRGTATIVGDAQRGRRMRQAADRGDATAQQAWEAAQGKAAGRRANHQRRRAGLGPNAQAPRGGFSQEEQARLAAQFDEQHRRQRAAVDRRCDSLAADLQAAEKRFDSDLKKMTAAVDQQFASERRERARELAAERTRTDDALERHRRDLQGQIDEFKQRAANEAAAADEWIAAATIELTSIKENPKQDAFCPGELAALEARLDMARGNRAKGLDQAAVAGAQEAALQGAFTREKLELLTARWEATRALAIQSLEAGLGALDAARSFRLSDVEVTTGDEARSEPAQEVDTDHWTGGAWAFRHGELGEALERIGDPDASVSLDELEALRASAEEAASEAVALQVTAKYALMASLLRADLQARFADRLADAGYAVVDNAWLGNDERAENHLVLRGVAGDEISIVLAPKAGESCFSNKVKVLFRTGPGHPNEQERAERLEAITQILRDAYDLPGDAAFLDCTPGTETRHDAAPEAFDLDRVRASKPAVTPQVRKGV